MNAVDVALTKERNGHSSFEWNFTPNEEQIDLINRTLDYIEENPEKWDQRYYGHRYSQTNCFFGMLLRVSDNHEFYDMVQGLSLLGMDPGKYWDRATYVGYWKSSHFEASTAMVDELRERVSIAFNHDFHNNAESNTEH